MIRVLLVAPSPAMRAGLRSLLASDAGIRVAAERSRLDGYSENEDEADVVVTTSASFVSRPRPDENSDVLLPVLYVGDEPPIAQNSAARGAWGALPAEASSGELCAAVRALAEGLVVGSPHLLFGNGERAAEGSPLTEREAEVLQWLARGLANKQIAAQLGISEHTVKFHVSSIYGKLNATNRTQAVREGLRNGWIPL